MDKWISRGFIQGTINWILLVAILVASWTIVEAKAVTPAFMESVDEAELQAQFPGQVVVFEVKQYRCVLWRNTEGMAKGSGTMVCEDRPKIDANSGFKVLGIYPKN